MLRRKKELFGLPAFCALLPSRDFGTHAGKPAAYKLVPTAAPTLLATDDSLIAVRGGFSRKNLWVTPYSPAESYPSGDWVLQSMGGDGLEAWTKQVCCHT